MIDRLTEQMNKAAREMRFEQAAQLRDRIRDAQNLMERQKAINVNGGDQDIIACTSDDIDAMVEVVYVRGGHMIGAENYALDGAGDQSAAQILGSFIMQFYDDGRRPPAEILCMVLPEQAEDIAQALSERKGAKVAVFEPQRGTKHKLVELALKNAKDALAKRNAHLARAHERTVGACEALAKAVGMDHTPRRIEGYDISNTQGVLSVASMVVAIDGEAARKEYRIFRIKTVVGANDFASMNEVLTRRLTRATQEREALAKAGRLPADGRGLSGFADLPDLILIDGGPQQLRFAREAMLKVGLRHPDFRPCQAAGGDLPAGSGGEHPARPQVARAAPDSARPRRGAPLRHHPPPRPAPKGGYALHAGGYPRRRRDPSARAADAFQVRRQHRGGHAGGALRGGGHRKSAGKGDLGLLSSGRKRKRRGKALTAQVVDISKLGLNSKIKKFSYSFICGKGYSPPSGENSFLSTVYKIYSSVSTRRLFWSTGARYCPV